MVTIFFKTRLKVIVPFLALILLIQTIVPTLVWAQSAPDPSVPLNLDLSSTDRNLSASAIGLTTPVDIVVGGNSITVNPNSLLTAAELVAAQQVALLGTQTLQLGAAGNAISGQFSLNSTLGQSLSNLVIPSSVQMMTNAAILPNLSLTGNLTGAGSLVFFSSDAAITQANILANNISILTGGSLTSIAYNGGLGLSLNLSAINNIINQGTIASAGNLTMTAGNSIVNALPSGISGLASIMAAQQLSMQAANIVNQGQIAAQLGTLNVMTSNLVNSGLMQSLSSSMNIASLGGNVLNINNLNGVLSAANELNLVTNATTFDISGNLLSKANLTVKDGALSGSSVNLVSPDGLIDVRPASIAGSVNIDGGLAVVGVSQGSLSIASAHLSNDPIFFNSSGLPLDIAGDLAPTNGGDFIVLSAGDITSSVAGTIDASNGTNTGGKVTLAAGADFTISGNPLCVNCDGAYTINGPSGFGGNILLSNVGITTGATTVSAIAYSGSSSAGTIDIGSISNVGGTVSLNAAGMLSIYGNIDTSGFLTAVRGSITLIGSPVNLQNVVGEINATTITISPSTSQTIYLGAVPDGVNFNLSVTNLSKVRGTVINIGDSVNTASIEISSNLVLNNVFWGTGNFITAGGFTAFTGGVYRTLSYGTGSLGAFNIVSGSSNIILGQMTGSGSFSAQANGGGLVSLNGNLAFSGGVSLTGAPVLFNGRSIDAQFGSVILQSSLALAVNLGGAVESGTTFDITAADLANIKAFSVTIGNKTNSTTVNQLAALNVSGNAGTDFGAYSLNITSTGAYTGNGNSITLGDQSLSIATDGAISLGAIQGNGFGTTVNIAAGGALTLNGAINLSGGGGTFANVFLSGAPITFNNQTINAGTDGFISLRPSASMDVTVGDATGTTSLFDISAAQLANFTAATLQIGDIFNAKSFTIGGNIDISARPYNIVFISAGALTNPFSITLGARTIGISTNGGTSNLATGNLDFSYLFVGSNVWKPMNSSNFVLQTGGDNSTSYVTNGVVDLASATGADGLITIVAGGNVSYTPLGSVISFGPGAGITGGSVGTGVSFSTPNNNINITAYAGGTPFAGGISVGDLNATASTANVTLNADSGITFGTFGSGASRAGNNFTAIGKGFIGANGSVSATNITLQSTANNGSVFSFGNLFAGNTLNIATDGTGIVWFLGFLQSVEAPTINITTVDQVVNIGGDTQIVTPANLSTPGFINIVAATVQNDGNISVYGQGGQINISSNSTDLAITNSFQTGNIQATGGTVTLSSATGAVTAAVHVLRGTLNGTAQTTFTLNADGGALTLGDITAAGNIGITNASDSISAVGSIQSTAGSITLTTSARQSMFTTGTIQAAQDLNITSQYLQNTGALTAGNQLQVQNTGDVVIVGSGSLNGSQINLNSTAGAVIANQNSMQGTVNASATGNLAVSVLDQTGFITGTITTPNAVNVINIDSGQIIYAAVTTQLLDGSRVIVLSDNAAAAAVNLGVLSVGGATGNLAILMRSAPSVTSIDPIFTDGGNIVIDSTNAGALGFNGDLSSRALAGAAGYIAVNAAGAINTQNVAASGTAAGNGGAIRITTPG